MPLTTLIQTSQNGSTYTNLKTPSTYSISYEDLDTDSFRSVVNGNLNRSRLKPRWVKLTISYSYLTASEVKAIAQAINTNQKYYVKIKSPAFPNISSPVATDNDWISFVAYTSKYNCEMLEGQVGWTMSFSIIQADSGTFQ